MWEAIAGAAASLIGSYFSNRSQAKSQEQTNQTNVNLNQENRDWMENLSNTSYQRGVKDMEAAGLNPMLAYSQGGASTPSSAAPTVAPVPRLGQGVGEGIVRGTASAMQGAQLASTFQNIEQSKAQQDLLSAQAARTRSETMDQNLNTALLAARVREAGFGADIRGVEAWLREGTKAWSAKQAMAEGDIKEFEARRAENTFSADVAMRKADARRAAAEATLSEQDIPRSAAESHMYQRAGGEAIPYLGPLLDMIHGVSSAKRAFSPERRR